MIGYRRDDDERSGYEYFPEDEKLKDIYDGLEKKHQIDLSQLLSHSRLTFVSTENKLKDQYGSTR